MGTLLVCLTMGFVGLVTLLGVELIDWLRRPCNFGVKRVGGITFWRIGNYSGTFVRPRKIRR